MVDHVSQAQGTTNGKRQLAINARQKLLRHLTAPEALLSASRLVTRAASGGGTNLDADFCRA